MEFTKNYNSMLLMTLHSNQLMLLNIFVYAQSGMAYGIIGFASTRTKAIRYKTTQPKSA